MPAVFSRFGLLLLLIGLLAPSTAAAWTRTEVRGMRARAEVMPSGFARVGLEITVEVQGGWVERFEIAGLGQGARLDELKPPTWIKASAALDDTDATAGTKYVTAINLRDDGTLSLDFGGAPRRLVGHVTQRSSTRRLINDGTARSAVDAELVAARKRRAVIDAPRGTVHLPPRIGTRCARELESGAITTVHRHAAAAADPSARSEALLRAGAPPAPRVPATGPGRTSGRAGIVGVAALLRR